MRHYNHRLPYNKGPVEPGIATHGSRGYTLMSSGCRPDAAVNAGWTKGTYHSVNTYILAETDVQQKKGHVPCVDVQEGRVL